VSSLISSSSRVLACLEAIAPFGRQTFVMRSCTAESVITHIWPPKAIDKDGAMRQAVQRSYAGLSNLGIRLRVGHDLNNKPIRKFHRPIRGANSSKAVVNDFYLANGMTVERRCSANGCFGRMGRVAQQSTALVVGRPISSIVAGTEYPPERPHRDEAFVANRRWVFLA
jgi:hypothetical protein